MGANAAAPTGWSAAVRWSADLVFKLLERLVLLAALKYAAEATRGAAMIGLLFVVYAVFAAWLSDAVLSPPWRGTPARYPAVRWVLRLLAFAAALAVAIFASSAIVDLAEAVR